MLLEKLIEAKKIFDSKPLISHIHVGVMIFNGLLASTNKELTSIPGFPIGIPIHLDLTFKPGEYRITFTDGTTTGNNDVSVGPLDKEGDTVS